MTPTYCTITLLTTNEPGFWEFAKTSKIESEVVIKLPTHMKAGKTFTATGYGFRIPTEFMVVFKGKRRRVFACCFSNAATYYIGPSLERGHIVEFF